MSPISLAIMSIYGIKYAIREKEHLKKNAKYPNIIPSRYEAIWGISIIGYSIIEWMNFLPNFSHTDETNYLSLIMLSYLTSTVLLFHGERRKIT
jgi:hypothetical protein